MNRVSRLVIYGLVIVSMAIGFAGARRGGRDEGANPLERSAIALPELRLPFGYASRKASNSFCNSLNCFFVSRGFLPPSFSRCLFFGFFTPSFPKLLYFLTISFA